MRKILSVLMVALLFSTNSNAKKEITGEFQPWDENCVVNGNTIDFLGEWNGITFKFYDDENCVYEGGTNFLDYDVIVLQMSDASCMFKIKTEYTDGANQQDSWGTEATAQPGALFVAVPLNPDHKDMVKDFYIQSAKYPGSLTIDKIYACTTEEYEALSSSQAPVFNLTLKKIDEGGGSNYNADTQTITIESDGSHRGWYFDEEFRNFSIFDSFVIEFKEVTSVSGEIGIEYDDNTSTTNSFEVGTDKVTVPLTESKDKLRQVYVKGNANATCTLQHAFFTSESSVTSIKGNSSSFPRNDGDGKVEYYSIDGRKLSAPARGITIQKVSNKKGKMVLNR